MAALEIILAAAFVVGMSFFMLGGHLTIRFADTWKDFLSSFCPATDELNSDTRSRPCVLSINNKNVGNDRVLNYFSPHVLALREGLVFTMRPQPFPAPPVLVRYDQVKSFARVRDRDGEWIVEFLEGETHCWAHLPSPVFEEMKGYAIAQEIPQFRALTELGEESLHFGRGTAAILEKELGCSPWVAEMLETLEDRDPLDAYNDVNILWKVAHHYVNELSWQRADDCSNDSSTSYWLIAAIDSLREQMGKAETTTTQHQIEVKRDVSALLQITRARMDNALGKATTPLFSSQAAPSP
jgi:hypothetical protein